MSERPALRYFRRLDICEHYNISSRTFDRMRADGKVPPPDRMIGESTALWSAATVEALFPPQAKPKAKPKAKAGKGV
jgi:hypothetical protein